MVSVTRENSSSPWDSGSRSDMRLIHQETLKTFYLAQISLIACRAFEGRFIAESPFVFALGLARFTLYSS